jgi:hypothetical protein
MPHLITPDFVANLTEITDLAILTENVLEVIKKDDLLVKKGREKYTQQELANYLGLDVRLIGYARQPFDNKKRGKLRFTKEKYIDLYVSIAEHFRLLVDDQLNVYSFDSKPTDFISALAEKLALNLVDISTSPLKPIKTYDKIFTDPRLVAQRMEMPKPQRERYLAVVGAGASNAASHGDDPMPTSKVVIEKLRSSLEQLVDKELIEEEIERQARLRGTPKEDFETQLLALNRFSAKKVRKLLTEICGNKHAPCLAYEILAHLLKHRFLDGIINFNYDELLDNAVQEELPDSDDYRFIYSAGHCPTDLEEIRIEKRLKQPIYVKCHGTISQPNSLRFSEEQAFTMEAAIQKHIGQLLAGKALDSPKEQLPINIIVIGFAMKNKVFNQLIENALVQDKQKITIWILDTDPSLRETVNKQFNGLPSNVRKNLEVKQLILDDEYNLEKALTQLWDQITGLFQQPYKPRGIARHELLRHIFPDISPSTIGEFNDDVRKQYYRDRLYVELFILILKSIGMVHLSQIPNGRVGKYLHIIEQEEKYSGNSIHDYLKDMGMKVYESFMYDTYLIKEQGAFAKRDKLIKYLHKRLMKMISLPAQEAISQDEDHFFQLAEGIRKRRLLKINPKYVHPHDNLFAKLGKGNVMNTSFAWIYNYRRNIEQRLDEWDLMLTISEEGSFLYGDAQSGIFKDKSLEIILATYGVARAPFRPKEKLKDLNLLSGELNYRPWWLHNKHLVLLLKRRPDTNSNEWQQNWKLVEGFFYRQNMLSQRVNPVKVTEEQDLLKLLYIFAIYWDGAVQNPRDIDQPSFSMPIIIQNKKLKNVLDDLFELYEQNRK